MSTVAPKSPLAEPEAAPFPEAPVQPAGILVLPEELPPLLYFTFAGPDHAADPNRREVWRWENGNSTQTAEIELPQSEDGYDCLESNISPAGTHLACMIPTALWVMGLDGQPGEVIVRVEDLARFATNDNPSTESPRYVDEPPAALGGFTWLPDNTRLLFSTRAAGFYAPLKDDLYLVDITTRDITRLFAPGEGGANIALAPDEKHIAVVSPTQIQLLRTDTLEMINRLAYEAISYSPPEYLYAPVAWYAREAAVALIPPPITHERPRLDHQGMTGGPETEVWRIPLDGSASTLVGTVPSRSGLHLSPGAEYVLYWTLREQRLIPAQYDQSIYQLHYYSTDTGETGLIYEGTWMLFLGWLPDGTSFLLAEQNEPWPARLIDLAQQVWQPWLSAHAPQVGMTGQVTHDVRSWLDDRTFVAAIAKAGRVSLETVDGASYPLFEIDRMTFGFLFLPAHE